MWAKHDVFGPSLHSRHHLQPQHLPRLLILAHLLPPRGEFSPTAASGFHSAQRHHHLCVSHQQTCSNEMKCICHPDYTGKDCSVFDPIPIPTQSEGPEKYRGKHTHSQSEQFCWLQEDWKAQQENTNTQVKSEYGNKIR